MLSQYRFQNDEERNAEKIQAIQFGTELAQKLDPLICDLLNDFVGSLDYPETAQSSLQEVTDVDLQADVPDGTSFGYWWLAVQLKANAPKGRRGADRQVFFPVYIIDVLYLKIAIVKSQLTIL